MTTHFRAHFDGKVLVPDEPADLPVGEVLEVKVSLAPSATTSLTAEQRRVAYERLLSRIHSHPVPRLSAEAIDRESIYGDR